MKKNSKNKRISEVLWTVDAVLRLLESHYCIKVDKINWGSFSLKQNFFLKWGTPTLKNTGNRWKNPDFQKTLIPDLCQIFLISHSMTSLGQQCYLCFQQCPATRSRIYVGVEFHAFSSFE
jgi:hypothetical protein